jgi:transposase
MPKRRCGRFSHESYRRALLIAGARAVVSGSAHSNWVERLLQRRHFNVVVAAVANKMARTVWAVLAKGAAFDQVKWNPVAAGSV